MPSSTSATPAPTTPMPASWRDRAAEHRAWQDYLDGWSDVCPPGEKPADVHQSREHAVACKSCSRPTGSASGVCPACGPQLDAIDALLALAAATTPQEVSAARLAAIRAGRPALVSDPIPGEHAGRRLLGVRDDVPMHRVLAARVGTLTRRGPLAVVDHTSSASVQHFIDTGDYLTVGEQLAGAVA